MAETQVYGVVLPVILAEKARVIAAMEGKSRSKLMRELLISYLARVEIPGQTSHLKTTEKEAIMEVIDE